VQDYLDPANAENMPDAADSLIAMDFLMTVKSGVRNLAASLSETASPEVRALIQEQLEAGLALHEALSALMAKKGWLHPYEPPKQFLRDLRGADFAARVAAMELYPGDTDRRGLFATPTI